MSGMLNESFEEFVKKGLDERNVPSEDREAVLDALEMSKIIGQCFKKERTEDLHKGLEECGFTNISIII